MSSAAIVFGFLTSHKATVMWHVQPDMSAGFKLKLKLKVVMFFSLFFQICATVMTEEKLQMVLISQSQLTVKTFNIFINIQQNFSLIQRNEWFDPKLFICWNSSFIPLYFLCRCIQTRCTYLWLLRSLSLYFTPLLFWSEYLTDHCASWNSGSIFHVGLMDN